MTDATVATLEFGGRRRAYTLAQLQALHGVPVDRVPVAHVQTPKHLPEPAIEAIRRAIREALTHSRGDVDQAAAALGVSRRTLYNNCHRYGITPSAFRELPCATA